jgi:hypothetical protein
VKNRRPSGLQPQLERKIRIAESTQLSSALDRAVSLGDAVVGCRTRFRAASDELAAGRLRHLNLPHHSVSATSGQNLAITPRTGTTTGGLYLHWPDARA